MLFQCSGVATSSEYWGLLHSCTAEDTGTALDEGESKQYGGVLVEYDCK